MVRCALFIADSSVGLDESFELPRRHSDTPSSCGSVFARRSERFDPQKLETRLSRGRKGVSARIDVICRLGDNDSESLFICTSNWRQVYMWLVKLPGLGSGFGLACVQTHQHSCGSFAPQTSIHRPYVHAIWGQSVSCTTRSPTSTSLEAPHSN